MASRHSPPMSDNGFPVDVASWLSDLTSNISPLNTPTNPACKRKRSYSANKLSAGNKLPRLQHKISTYAILATVSPSSLNRSSSVPENPKAATSSFPSDMDSFPLTPVQQGKKRAWSPRKGTSSSGQDYSKQTDNVHNVRTSLCKQGLFFEKFECYDKYPEFQAKIDKLVFRDRGSVMRTESVRKIKQWRRKNATEDEPSYYASLEPRIIKAERTTLTSKRSLDGILIEESRKFEDDLLHRKKDCQFAHEYEFFPPAYARLSGFVNALIGVAPGLQHAFFGIENKGCAAPIEEAKNQALRTGTALVNAFRQLVKASKVGDQEEEKAGVDDKTFAFTCSWAPQMAKIHVHWHELQEDGSSHWHMNVLRYYLLDCDDHMKNFRRDIYNSLDWGVGCGRQRMLREMVAKIAMKDPQIVSSEQL